MPSFRYRALAASGRIETGVVESTDRGAAVSALQAKGFIPIEAREAASGRGSLLRLPPLRRSGASSEQLGLALQELSVLLTAGLPLDRALDLLSEQLSSSALRAGFSDILALVRRGQTLSEAITAHPALFPTSVATLIEAGEAGGTLETSLARAAEMLLRAAALREAITGALLYPAILLVVAGLSLVIILSVVLPQFKTLFDDAGAALPLPTQIVMAIGDFFGDYWFALLALAALLGLMVRRALRRPAFRLNTDRRLLQLPILGSIVAKTEIARFARTLGTLVENGIPLPAALGITHRGFRNTALAVAVDQVGKSLKEGEGLAGPLEATGLFPRTALHLIRVGEETARLGEMLDRLADILEREVQRAIQRGLTLLVPLITVGMGALIAGIIASILVAILSLNHLAL